MKVLLVLLGCLAYAAASDLDCGPIAALKVKAQWARIYGHTSETRETLGHEIFDYMFDHSPESRELFSRVRGDNIYSAKFDAHMMRVFGGLDIAISLLNEETLFKAQIAHLRAQHEARPIPGAAWALFEKAMWHSVPIHVGEIHFDQDAWHGCLSKILNGITSWTTPRPPPIKSH